MIIQQDTSSALYQIQRIDTGKIWINQQCYECSVIIRPRSLLAPWGPRTMSDLTAQDFASIYADPPEILLLGTGSKLIIPSKELIYPLMEQKIGVEFMDSKAACFTYMALACEDRVVAACILVD